MTETHIRRTSVLIWTLAVVCAVSLALSGWALLARFTESNQLRADQARVWHAVVCSIETQILKDQHADVKQQRQALGFYDRLLTDDVHTSPCHLLEKTRSQP